MADRDARRGSAFSRGYNTRWQKLAGAFKKRNPFCLGCRAVDKLEVTAVADHIVPHKGNDALLWDERNLQPACRFHHDVVKRHLEIAYQSGEIEASELRLDSATSIKITTDLGWSEGGGG